MGSYNNIKITSPEDINIGEKILSLRKLDHRFKVILQRSII